MSILDTTPANEIWFVAVTEAQLTRKEPFKEEHAIKLSELLDYIERESSKSS